MHKFFYSCIATFLLSTSCKGMGPDMDSPDTFEDLAKINPAFKNFRENELRFDLDDTTIHLLAKFEIALWTNPLSIVESQKLLLKLHTIIREKESNPGPLIIHGQVLSQSICVISSDIERQKQEKRRQKKERQKKNKASKKQSALIKANNRDCKKLKKALGVLKDFTPPHSPLLHEKSKISQTVRSLKKKDGNRPFKPGRYKIDILVKALDAYMKNKKSKRLAEFKNSLIYYQEKTGNSSCIIKKSGSELWIDE